MTSPIANIHASCIILAEAGRAFGAARDIGVLLVGESGAGKSDLALRLIERGAVLVADDRCDLLLDRESIRARAPLALQGMIEIRGVGIVQIPFVAEARIGLAVRLVRAQTIARLPERCHYEPPAALAAPRSVWPPEIAVEPFQASAPAKIAAAAAAFATSLFRDTAHLR